MSTSPQAGARFQYRGVGHVALVCRDMAETVEFYEGILEMPLIKAIDIPGGQHFFFDCGNGATIAFFWFKDAPPAAPGIASQPLDVRKDGHKSAIGSMNHLAIDITEDKFDEYLARLRAKGLAVNVINHNEGEDERSIELTPNTWIRSMYFYDPNGIKMELAALTRSLDNEDISAAPVDAAGRPVPVVQRGTLNNVSAIGATRRELAGAK